MVGILGFKQAVHRNEGTPAMEEREAQAARQGGMARPRRAPRPLRAPELDAVAGGQGGTDINDAVHGTDGNDRLNAGAGNDDVFGYDGDDVITEIGTGNDYICGGRGHDFVNALGGHDTILAGHGADTILGGDGDDVIELGKRFDWGYERNDGSTGNDLLFGQAGNDRVVWTLTRETGATVRFDGGPGADTIELDPGHMDQVGEPVIHAQREPFQIGNALIFGAPTSGRIVWNGSVLHFTNVERIILPG
jgi:Ca2+-binding RTX toxin-like protein